MLNYIIEYEDSIPDLLCEEIIENFNNCNESNYKKGRTLGGINTDVLDSLDININIDDKEKWKKQAFLFLCKELLLKIKSYLATVNIYTNELNQDNLFVRQFIIRKYEKNKGKYVYHSDTLHCFSNTSTRVISFIWYLNDIDVGGDTVFFYDKNIRPKKGKLVLFPSTWTFPHTGTVPISDDKYIIVGWIEQKFR
jgi:hypothetical protein